MHKTVLIVVAICIVSILLILWLPWDADSGKEGDGAQAAETSLGGEDLPPLVGPLDCVPSDLDGLGKASLTSTDPVQAGSVENFEITFTTAEPGIEAGGFIIFQVSPWWGWTQPQNLNPDMQGYVKVTPSFEDSSFKVFTLQLNRILVYSGKRGFKPGDKVVFNYGPAQVDKYAEGEELFQILVDGDGDGHYACIENTPKIRILPHNPVFLTVDCRSRAAPGQTVEVRATPMDPMGNRCRFEGGAYSLEVIRNDGDPEEGETLYAERDKGSIVFPYTVEDAGVYSFIVKGARMSGKSNVLWCQGGDPQLNLYFGDIHGHSRLSDGTGTPEDYYRFAREVSGLDIAALTDHSDWGTIPVPGKVWDRMKKAANDAYEPGEFVTFAAFEWTSWTYGHRNVYYRDGEGPIFRSLDKVSDTPQKLWTLLEPHEAMTIAHHVGGGPIHTDWSIPPGPKEWLVEISSVHGCSEYFRGERCIYQPVQGAFVRDALNRGYRLGILASGDTHDGHPGQRSRGAVVTGKMAVFAPELTREAVWDAFKRRHVYGTSGPKILLFFRVGDSPMGSEVEWSEEQGPIPIAVMAVGCEKIKFIEIIRNGEMVFKDRFEDSMVRLLIEDPKPEKGTSWYYVRVLQEDGEMAWSSPVWVTYL